MKRFTRRTLPAILCMTLLSAGNCAALFGTEEHRPTHYDKVIRVAGGGAAIAWIFEPLREQFEDESRIGLKLDACGPGQGLEALLRGDADVATGAVTLDSMIRFARNNGAEVDASTLRVSQLGENRTLAMVHEANAVTALSKEQLKGIFTGRIVNWKDVGGADAPITVVWGTKTPGQNALFTEKILDGEAVTGTARVATDYADIIAKVVADPHAVGIDPSGYVRGGVRTPPCPELAAPIISVTRGEPSPEVRKLYDFILEVSDILPH